MKMAISNRSLKVLPKVKPYFYMVFQQFLLAVMYVLAEATLKNGMSQFVLVVYRNIVGVLFIAPFAFWFERKRRPRITVAIFLKIVALAILDPVLQQNSFYVGAKMTSASFASALENIIPAITYLMVLALRMEKLEIKRRFCQAKVIGAIANVAGAVLMIVYQGPNLPFPWNFNQGGDQNNITEGEGGSNWLQGTFFIIASSTSWSLFLILQSNTLESFPAELSLTVLICSMGAVMSAVVALVVQHGDLRPWVVGWDSRLFVSVYAGITCTGGSYYLQGVVIKDRGPVFVSAFGPLCIVFTMALGPMFLSEKISLGMFVGVIIMVAGLYAILWANSKDQVSSKTVRDAGEQELPVIAPTLGANAKHSCQSNVVDNSTSIEEGQRQETGTCSMTNKEEK